MKKSTSLFLLLFTFASFALHATHNRAGEISYKQIGLRDYQVTISTYTKMDAPADRCELEVRWGDGSTEILPRQNGAAQGGCSHWGEPLYNQIKKNIYTGTHTYNYPGIFKVSMHDYNRNEGIKNIQNSVFEPFYIESYIIVGTNNVSTNNSAVLLNPPVDLGCIYTPFIHNLGAYDPDGDSLGYRLVNCRGLDGRELTDIYNPIYNLDPGHLKISLDGTLTWDSPKAVGEYNIAIEIIEYRKNANGTWSTVGKILRDMQIDIADCNNTPPKIQCEDVYCVTAGNKLEFDVEASDPDGSNISLSAIGGPFISDNPPYFETRYNVKSPAVSKFIWIPDCSQARDSYYSITFKANDHPIGPNGNESGGLSTQKTVKIKVLIPPPAIKSATQTDSPSGIKVGWFPITCTKVSGYKIYRKKYNGELLRTPCTTGVPSDSGYELVGTVSGDTTVEFIDTEAALDSGIEYFYIVTGYTDLTESGPSDPTSCIYLKDVPLVTHTSVENTDPSTGEISVKWTAPSLISTDVSLYPPPYSYEVLYADHAEMSVPQNLGWTGSDWVNDRDHGHSGINTAEHSSHVYRINFYADAGAKLVGESSRSTSLFLNAAPANNKAVLSLKYNVPWGIDSIQYYKKATEEQDFQYLVTLKNDAEIRRAYTDTGVSNGNQYLYYAKVFGNYTVLRPKPSFWNFSQIAVVVPKDMEVECPPTLYLEQNCEDAIPVVLRWINPQHICHALDIVGYRIYHREATDDNYNFDLPLQSTADTTYIIPSTHQNGFFVVKAEDNNGNLSEASNEVEVKKCSNIRLPNVFTPNGDGANDRFIPLVVPPAGDFKITIYNRWGGRVFETDNPAIEWDGKSSLTGTDCSEGVYYYLCTLKPEDTDLGEKITQTGFVHLFR